MKGKIEIVCDEKGTHLSVNIEGNKESDRLFLVHALGKALDLTHLDYMVLATAEMEGVMDGPLKVTIDEQGFKQQMEEMRYES